MRTLTNSSTIAAVVTLAFADPATAFEPLFAQRALLAVLALAFLAGAIGPLIVLRDLPFFAHAVGGGAYPLLVVAAGIGAPLAAFAPLGALLFATALVLVGGFGPRAGRNRDGEIAVVLVAAFALGSVLAATLFAGDFGLGLSPEALLFGSVLTAGAGTIAIAVAACALCGGAVWIFGRHWLASGFDPPAPRAPGWRAREAGLLVVVALAVAATLPLAGAMMGAALLVVPAATARMLSDRFDRLFLLTLAIAICEGVIGLYLALILDLPPGALIATLAGVVFGAVALLRTLATRGSSLRPALATAFLLAALAATGCGSDSDDTSGVPVVVATTTQVGDIVRQVGGDDVRVVTLLKPGGDPHEYQPSPSDVPALADADAVFASGGELDEWLADALQSSGVEGAPVELAKSVTLIDGGGESGNGDKAFNPHWYLAPANLVAAAGRTRDELAKTSPDLRETYRANAKRYADQVDVTATDLTSCADTIPQANRLVLAEHDDFAYLAAFLGIEIEGQLRAAGSSEASARDVDDAIAAARSKPPGAVLASAGESTKLAHTVAERLDVPLLELHADSLADSGMARTSLGAIADDTKQIVKALGGKSGLCPRVAS